MKKMLFRSIKIYFLLLFCFLKFEISYSQLNQGINYQSVIRDSQNQLIKNSQIGIKISLVKDSISGDVLYSETHIVNTNDNGLLTLQIGKGNTTGDFSSINWSGGIMFLKTEIDPTGGDIYSITGINQMLSVPYALYAEKSGTSGEKGEPGKDGLTTTVNGVSQVNGEITITKSDLGLANVDNTSDADKPMSKETKAYIDALRAEIDQLQVAAGLKIKDVDGNTYKTANIGTQVWLAENLKTTKYNDGSSISSSWTGTEGAYAWYNNDELTYKNTYGALYNWYALDSSSNGNKNICPIGWHVPTDAEWTILSDFFGGPSSTGSKLKEVGVDHWNSSSASVKDEYGFTALPGGYRFSDGTFDYIGSLGNWWSATTGVPDTDAWYRHIADYSGYFNRDDTRKAYGFSVRCLQD